MKGKRAGRFVMSPQRQQGSLAGAAGSVASTGIFLSLQEYLITDAVSLLDCIVELAHRLPDGLFRSHLQDAKRAEVPRLRIQAEHFEVVSFFQSGVASDVNQHESR